MRVASGGGGCHGLAIPPFYRAIGSERLTLPLGHFHAIVGYEGMPAASTLLLHSLVWDRMNMPIEDRDRAAAGLQPPSQAVTPATTSLGRQQWLVLAAAMLGWMFDGLEMGLFPIAARPALQDLLAITDDRLIGQWNSYLVALFLGGAACGGLLFGWLGDRMGRVRTMALSILAYSFFTGCCYFAAAPWQLGVLRFFAALGMGGEWALGVALVMECWPERLRPSSPASSAPPATWATSSFPSSPCTSRSPRIRGDGPCSPAPRRPCWRFLSSRSSPSRNGGRNR